jgi:hypothetical protein
MTSKDIRKEIQDVRREMKERGIRKVSCFNGGLDASTYQANARLFRLGVKLDNALKLEAQQQED